jgi:hypothetical protein
MKYTKDFEKYWKNARQNIYDGENSVSENVKHVASRAWKAGIEKTKRDYDLIQHKSMEPSKFLPS